MEIIKKLRKACFIGLLVSCYATYVELRAEQDAQFRALCDINTQISCTTVFTSPYGRTFGIMRHVLNEDSSWNPPNGILGICFYTFIFLTTYTNNSTVKKVVVWLCLLANILSIYLAYLLYFVLRSLCLVCVFIYIENFVCLVLSWKLLRKQFKQKPHELISKSKDN